MSHCLLLSLRCVFFFFNDSPTTQIYTLSLHDALPIYLGVSLVLAAGDRHEGDDEQHAPHQRTGPSTSPSGMLEARALATRARSEEHTSELQSQSNLVCRLLLEKKKKS